MDKTPICPMIFALRHLRFLLGATATKHFRVQTDLMELHLKPIATAIGGCLAADEPAVLLYFLPSAVLHPPSSRAYVAPERN
jgi:hypothetical protein